MNRYQFTLIPKPAPSRLAYAEGETPAEALAKMKSHLLPGEIIADTVCRVTDPADCGDPEVLEEHDWHATCEYCEVALFDGAGTYCADPETDDGGHLCSTCYAKATAKPAKKARKRQPRTETP